jgi:hypothetical protein
VASAAYDPLSPTSSDAQAEPCDDDDDNDDDASTAAADDDDDADNDDNDDDDDDDDDEPKLHYVFSCSGHNTIGTNCCAVLFHCATPFCAKASPTTSPGLL